MVGIDVPASALTAVTKARTRQGNGDVLAWVGTGLAILLIWEAIVRAFAPPYVATPSGILRVIPSVIVDKAFLDATAITLTAVAQGLAIAIVIGTIIGLAMGRSLAADRG